jgi:hypothetical protein
MKDLEGAGIKLSDMGIKPASWEERLVVQCRSKLAVKPKKAEAVLFYDQLPMGGQDDASLHGGCPVLKGTKWAANLWVWNGNVHGDDIDTAGTKPVTDDTTQLQAEFVSLMPGYSLYWQDTFFAALAPGTPVRMNTFEGHVFNIHEGADEKSKGARVASFVMQANTGRIQQYVYPTVDQAAAGAKEVKQQQQEYSDDEDEVEGEVVIDAAGSFQDDWDSEEEEEEEEEEYVYEDEDE